MYYNTYIHIYRRNTFEKFYKKIIYIRYNIYTNNWDGWMF